MSAFGWSSTTDEVLAERDLTGLTVFITGANGGLGRLTSLSLLEAGHTVVATMRNIETRNAAAAGELRAAGAHVVGDGGRLQRLVIGRQVTCKTTHLRLQRQQRRGQVVGGQEHPLAGMPGTEQRRSEGHGVIEVERPVTTFGSAESVMPGQYAQAEGDMVEGSAIADTDVTTGLRRDQQPVQGNPVSHARALP